MCEHADAHTLAGAHTKTHKHTRARTAMRARTRRYRARFPPPPATVVPRCGPEIQTSAISVAIFSVLFIFLRILARLLLISARLLRAPPGCMHSLAPLLRPARRWRRASQGLEQQRDRRDGARVALRAHQADCPVRPPAAALCLATRSRRYARPGGVRAGWCRCGERVRGGEERARCDRGSHLL
jgi:hypothetical protein